MNQIRVPGEGARPTRKSYWVTSALSKLDLAEPDSVDLLQSPKSKASNRRWRPSSVAPLRRVDRRTPVLRSSPTAEGGQIFMDESPAKRRVPLSMNRSSPASPLTPALSPSDGAREDRRQYVGFPLAPAEGERVGVRGLPGERRFKGENWWWCGDSPKSSTRQLICCFLQATPSVAQNA
jgi:hypothetical protein